MKLTLRKANAVQLAINDIVKGLKFDNTVALNEFQDAEAVLQAATARFMANVTRRKSLVETLRDIRLAVGTANHQAGIDRRLTEIAHLEKQIQFFNGLAQADTLRDSMDVVKGKLDKIRNRKEESRASLYGRDDTVTTSVLYKEQIDGIKTEIKNLKKQKQKLNDSILELNIKTEIPLTEDTVKVLTDEGIL